MSIKPVWWVCWLLCTFLVMASNALAQPQFLHQQPVMRYSWGEYQGSSPSVPRAALQGAMEAVGYSLGSATPSDHSVNGIPLITRYEVLNSEGEVVGTQGISATAVCPPGFGKTSRVSGVAVELHCVQVLPGVANGATCGASVGNPIDIVTGNKYQHSVDYSTADGFLSVERHYLGQHRGWLSIDMPPRLNLNESVESTADAPPDTQARKTASAFTLSRNTRVSVPGQPPQGVTTTELVTPSLIGVFDSAGLADTQTPVLVLWDREQPIPFVSQTPLIPDPQSDPQHPSFQVPTGTVFHSADPAAQRQTLTRIDPDTFDPNPLDSSTLDPNSFDPNSPLHKAHWRLTRAKGDAAYFSATGVMVAQHFANGGFLRYDYALAPWYVARKTDHVGRSIDYHYDEQFRLTHIIAPGEHRIDYTYASDTPGTIAFELLQQVTWPSGRSVSYAYNEDDLIAGNTALPWALTGRFDSQGRRVGRYAYNAQGRTGFG